MKYISTRGKSEGVTSAFAIKKGLAEDGGLFFPEELPAFTKEEILSLTGLPYYKRCAFVLSKFLTDFSYEELEEDCMEAYSSFSPEPDPIHKLNEKIRILELWHGPTCAFKDMALQIMPKLLSRSLKKTKEDKTAYILVATSGDTGKAALEGYKNVDGIKIMVFYPVNGVSKIQKLQMATQDGNNVYVSSVNGNFDDAQNGVKKIFSDKAINDSLSEKGYILSSANSINWGRLAPQIAYYVSAYVSLIADGSIKYGDTVNVTVPTGNFGNILACYIAKLCGIPFGKLICASNTNNVLTDFFNTGIYNKNRQFYTTVSPSMDILISSNLERLLYLKVGQKKTAEFMEQLSKNGSYNIGSEMRSQLACDFVGLYSDENQTKNCIKKTFQNYNYLIDTHTAVALDCADRYINENRSDEIMLTVSTASPYKFASSVLSAIGGNVCADEFDNLTKLEEISGVVIPSSLASLKDKKIRFNPDDFAEKQDMMKVINNTL